MYSFMFFLLNSGDPLFFFFFFFNDTATTEIYTLSLHDALPIWAFIDSPIYARTNGYLKSWYFDIGARVKQDRKSTRLNSSHLVISYAVFCLKKKKKLPTRKQTGASNQLILIIHLWLRSKIHIDM